VARQLDDDEFRLARPKVVVKKAVENIRDAKYIEASMKGG
jgi:hypothetical protein